MADPQVNLWNTLPEECKGLILQQLSTKELARAARISMEFAETVRNIRNGVLSLVLPPNMKVSTMQGMVAAHANLRSLSFRRCGAKMKNFVPLLEAATGNNSTSVRGVPVFWRHRSLEVVDFRGCVHLTDADVAELCWLHSKIEDVNLTNCQALTDAALVTLSRHRRTNNVNALSYEDELDHLIDSTRLSLDTLSPPDMQSPEIAHATRPLSPQTVSSETKCLSFSDSQAWPVLKGQTKLLQVGDTGCTRSGGSSELQEDSGIVHVLDLITDAEDVQGAELQQSNKSGEVQSNLFSYAHAAARCSDTDDIAASTLSTTTHSDDSQDVQRKLENIKGWPKKVTDTAQVPKKSQEDADDRPGTHRAALKNSSTALPCTLSGGKLRFGSLIGSKAVERCMDPTSEGAGLQSVCLAGCTNITDKGVQSLLKGSSRTSLVSLDVSRCVGVTNNGLKIPSNSSLQNLTGVQMPSITRLRFLLPDEQRLRNLNLAYCTKLEELILVAPHLQTLNLSACKKLVSLQLKCPDLETLNISLCDNLQRFGRFECGSLQSVNAHGCRLLSTAAMAGVIESSGALQELRCSGCDQIDGLNLPQLSLVRVEVPGCSSLKRLISQSRILQVVDACGCKNLEEVRLQSPFLQHMLFTNCSRLKILVMPVEGIKTSALALFTKGGKGRDECFEISISGAYSLPEAVRRSVETLAKQLKCLPMV